MTTKPPGPHRMYSSTGTLPPSRRWRPASIPPVAPLVFCSGGIGGAVGGASTGGVSILAAFAAPVWLAAFLFFFVGAAASTACKILFSNAGAPFCYRTKTKINVI